jgi:trigger factor
MNVEKKPDEGCTVKLIVKADAAEIADECKKVLNTFLREASIPGFRKGKVPLAVIQQKFADGIKQESEQACFRKLYPQALKEAAVEPIELTGVTDVLLDPATGFSFTAIVEVRPEFSLPKYKKLAVKAGDTTVKDEAVEQQLEQFRVAFAKYEDAKEDETIGDGDFVNFDYKGQLNGQPLSEIVPDQKAVCGAEGFWTQIEDGRFLPEILAALKGMKAGETKKEVVVKFPDDAAPEALKGKSCDYELTVKSFRRRVLPDDKTFLENAKAESLDALRKDIRERLEKQAIAADLENRRNQAIELLLKKCDFDVPASLVRRQTAAYLKDLEQRAQYAGLSGDYIEQNRDKILADAENHAVQQVRLGYVLEEIAKAENIEIAEDDIEKGLERIAAAQREPTTAADVRQRFEENGNMEIFKDQLKAEKALDLVLAEAK